MACKCFDFYVQYIWYLQTQSWYPQRHDLVRPKKEFSANLYTVRPRSNANPKNREKKSEEKDNKTWHDKNINKNSPGLVLWDIWQIVNWKKKIDNMNEEISSSVET